MKRLSPRVEDALAYILSHYPYPNDLSKARTVKLLYLSDWVMAVHEGRQLTDVDWFFNHYGPYVVDIEDAVRASERLQWRRGVNAFGSPKETLVTKTETSSWPNLSSRDKEVIDHVISETQDLNFTEFLSLVYSTFPVTNSDRYDELDLPALAKEFAAKRGSV